MIASATEDDNIQLRSACCSLVAAAVPPLVQLQPGHRLAGTFHTAISVSIGQFNAG